MAGTEMDYTYQTQSFESGDVILVFDENGVFVRKILVAKSEFRPAAYAWVLGARFEDLYKGPTIEVLRWLEEHPDRVLAKQVGIGRDFQILSISEFKELYG